MAEHDDNEEKVDYSLLKRMVATMIRDGRKEELVEMIKQRQVVVRASTLTETMKSDRKRKRKGSRMKRVMIAVLAILINGCATYRPEIYQPRVVDVVYEVSGTVAPVKITFMNQSKGTSQVDVEELPWSFRFVTKGFTSVLLKAEALDGEGEIHVKIFVNQALYQFGDGKGTKPSAMASGVIGDDAY